MSGNSTESSSFCIDLVSPHAGSHGVVLHDLVFGLPTLAFLVFLGWHFRGSVRKLRRSQSHIMTTYYVFLWVISALNLLRCAVQLGQAELLNPVLWNIFLLIARYGVVLLEVSVVVFLLQGYLSSGREALLRTLWLSGSYAAVETLAAAAWVFDFHVPLFLYDGGDSGEADMRWSKWGFWLAHSMLFLSVYLGILVLPYTKWRDRLPAKPSFYHYVMFLFTLNILAAIGAILIGSGVIGGYCVYGVASFAYYALYPPLLYLTFLAEFFMDSELDGDLMYYSEMREAGYFDDQDYDRY